MPNIWDASVKSLTVKCVWTRGRRAVVLDPYVHASRRCVTKKVRDKNETIVTDLFDGCLIHVKLPHAEHVHVPKEHKQSDRSVVKVLDCYRPSNESHTSPVVTLNDHMRDKQAHLAKNVLNWMRMYENCNILSE